MSSQNYFVVLAFQLVLKFIKKNLGVEKEKKYSREYNDLGNLILEWSIREACIEDDIFIISDATVLESSDWIRFEQLDLPTDREAFQIWAEKHLSSSSSNIIAY
jgi:hypothetical protein